MLKMSLFYVQFSLEHRKKAFRDLVIIFQCEKKQQLYSVSLHSIKCLDCVGIQYRPLSDSEDFETYLCWSDTSHGTCHMISTVE